MKDDICNLPFFDGIQLHLHSAGSVFNFLQNCVLIFFWFVDSLFLFFPLSSPTIVLDYLSG